MNLWRDAERRKGIALFAAHYSQQFGTRGLLFNAPADQLLEEIVEHCAVSEALLGLVAAVAEECHHRRTAHAVSVQMDNGLAFPGVVVGRLEAGAAADRIGLLDILLGCLVDPAAVAAFLRKQIALQRNKPLVHLMN